MKIERVKFGDLFLYEGKSKIKAGSGLVTGEHPFYTSSNVLSKYLDEYSFEKISLIFGTGGMASVHYCKTPFAVSTDCLVAYVKDESICDTKFVYHYISGNIHLLEEGFKGAGLKHISKGYINELEIPLPPLHVQKQIVTILDAADALKRKDKELLKKYDELAQVIFIDMFGDPVKNEKGWDRFPLSELLEKIESGWSPVCLDREATSDEWGVLKLGAITQCVYYEHENKALPDKDIPRANIEVKSGDLLFSRKNTYQLVAACALVGETRDKLMLSDLIFRLKLKPYGRISKVYLHSLLTHPKKRSTIQSLAGGAAGSMPNISKEKLMQVQIEVPPPALQTRYEEAIQKLRLAHGRLEKSSLMSKNLFASLIQKAFKGELTS